MLTERHTETQATDQEQAHVPCAHEQVDEPSMPTLSAETAPQRDCDKFQVAASRCVPTRMVAELMAQCFSQFASASPPPSPYVRVPSKGSNVSHSHTPVRHSWAPAGAGALLPVHADLSKAPAGVPCEAEAWARGSGANIIATALAAFNAPSPNVRAARRAAIYNVSAQPTAKTGSNALTLQVTHDQPLLHAEMLISAQQQTKPLVGGNIGVSQDPAGELAHDLLVLDDSRWEYSDPEDDGDDDESESDSSGEDEDEDEDEDEHEESSADDSEGGDDDDHDDDDDDDNDFDASAVPMQYAVPFPMRRNHAYNRLC